MASEYELTEPAAKALPKSERRKDLIADLPVMNVVPIFGNYTGERMKTYKLES